MQRRHWPACSSTQKAGMANFSRSPTIGPASEIWPPTRPHQAERVHFPPGQRTGPS